MKSNNNNNKIDNNIHDLNKLKKYLNKYYNINVEEVRNQTEGDYFYPTHNLIELNANNSSTGKLCALLHEAGHVILRRNKKNNYFRFFANTVDLCNEEFLKLKSGCVEILNEEVLAWYVGYNLAKKLRFDIKWSTYERCMNNSIWTYVKYLFKKQKFERLES